MFSNAYGLLVMATICWGGNAVAGRLAADEWQSFTFTFVRWVITLLCILPFTYRHLKTDWPVLKQKGWVLICMGAFGMGLFNLSMYTALRYTSAVNASIEQSLMPILIVIANFLFFRQKVVVWQIVGVVLSVIGVVVTSTNGKPLDFFSGALNRGDALMILATVFYAAYTISLRWRPAVHWLSFLFMIACGAALVCLPLMLWEISTKEFIVPSIKGWLLITYAVIFPTIAQLAFARGVEPNTGTRFINSPALFPPISSTPRANANCATIVGNMTA